jgi:hypothetical protein
VSPWARIVVAARPPFPRSIRRDASIKRHPSPLPNRIDERDGDRRGRRRELITRGHMQTRDAGPPGAGALGRLSDSDGPVAGTEPERDPRIYPRRANHVAVGFRCPTPLLPSVCRLLACCGLILRSTRTNGPCTEHVNNNQVDLSFSLLFAVGFSFCFGKDQLKSTPAAGGRRRGASGGVCSSALSPAPRGKPGTVRSVWPVSVVGSLAGGAASRRQSERQAFHILQVVVW